MSFINALSQDFFGSIGRWQTQRPLWLVGGFTALFLDIFSFIYFQNILGLDPCEMCVYIRFSMVVIFIGAMIAALNPRWLILRLAGYIVVIWAIVRGILWSVHLDKIYSNAEAVRAGADPFSLGFITCSMFPTFPFGLPLDSWWPGVFAPQGLCGDSEWSLLGMNMAEWMLVVYAVFAVLIALMLVGGVVRLLRK